MQQAFIEAAAIHAEMASHQTQVPVVSDSTKKKFPEQLRSVATPSDGTIWPAVCILKAQLRSPETEQGEKTGTQRVALEEESSASHSAPLGRFLKPSVAQTILRSPPPAGSVYCTNTSTESVGICSLGLLNPFSASRASPENS